MVAEWSIENTRIVTELFVEQVRAGNRPNTHLTSNAYDEVGRQFKIRTGLEYNRDQLKNKWDKLRGDYGVFKKLKLKETGAGCDIERNTVKQDAEWWKKAKIDIPGCYKFRKHGLRNEENLRIMFEDYVRFHDKLDLHFVRCDRDPDYVPTISERYKKFTVPTNASDTSTSEENGVDMDLIRNHLATDIALGW